MASHHLVELAKSISRKLVTAAASGLAVLSLVAASTTAHADGGVPLGDPITVAQGLPNLLGETVARSPSGSFVVAWSDSGSFFAQRYSANGSALGAPIVVDTSGNKPTMTPVMAMNTAGEFAVAWTDTVGAHLQYFDAAGNPAGAPALVYPQSETSNSGNIAIALNDSGQAIVSWVTAIPIIQFPCFMPGWDCVFGTAEVWFAQYSSGGTLMHPATQVNSIGTFGINWPMSETAAVAMDGAGRSIVVWNNLSSIQARRYSSAGKPIGLQATVSTLASKPESICLPNVAADAKGDFVVTWPTQDSSGQNHIFVRRYNSLGFAEGSPFAVDPTPGYPVSSVIASVAMGQAGDFVVGWQSSAVPTSTPNWPTANYVERYDSAGHSLAPPYQLASVSGADDSNVGVPSLGSDASGNFVAVWNYYDATSTSASPGQSIIAQLFSGP
jgi:hypothetical protein